VVVEIMGITIKFLQAGWISFVVLYFSRPDVSAGAASAPSKARLTSFEFNIPIVDHCMYYALLHEII
jgi:hypothetical protein